MSNTVEADWVTNAGLRAVALWVNDSHRCGYVEVPKGHPLHGIDYHQEADCLSDFNPEDEPIGKRGALILFTAGVDAADGEIRRSPDVVFDVHGGLTYSGGGDGYPADGDGWWLGFDCAHAGDGTAGGRFTSGGPIRSLEYVKDECESLAAQIVKRVGILAA